MRAQLGTEIRTLATGPDPRWNAFVERHDAAGFFHLSEWAAVYADLSWVEPHFIYALRDDAIVGVMPLAIVRIGPLGRALVSAPYCVQAGAVADDEAALSALERHAEIIGRDAGAAFMEVRQTGQPNPDWVVRADFATFRRQLLRDDDANFAAIPRKQRAMVRKGQAAGLEARIGHDPALFYRLFSVSMRNLGTPVFSRRYFEALWVHLGNRIETLFVHRGAETVAAVLSFRHGHTIMPYYAGALAHARDLHANDFMYWEVMRLAAESGCTAFDFGRSVVGSGAFAFKRHWGFEPQPLTYRFKALKRNRGTGELEPDSPLNRIARGLWRRLPLGVANVAGPWLARRLY